MFIFVSVLIILVHRLLLQVCGCWIWHCLFSDLDKPTVNDSRDKTNRVGIITLGTVTGAAVITTIIIIIVISLYCYKMHKEKQKTQRRIDMPDAEKQRHETNIENLHKELLKALKDESLDQRRRNIYVNEIKKSLDFTRGLLAGDGSDEEV